MTYLEYIHHLIAIFLAILVGNPIFLINRAIILRSFLICLNNLFIFSENRANRELNNHAEMKEQQNKM